MVSNDVERHDAEGISLSELFARPLVLTPLPNARRKHLEVLAARYGARLDVMAESATMTAHLDLVARGLGAAVMPLSAARLMQREGVSIRPVKDLRSYRIMLTNRSPLRTLATDVVAQALRAMFPASGHHRA